MSKVGNTISVVDDDEGFCAAITWLLQLNGYSTSIHNSASSFMEHLPIQDSCALLDLQLGSANGIDLIKRARSSGYYAPIIIVSAFGTIPTAMRAGHNGAFEFLEKPVANEILLSSVHRACEAHQVHRQRLGEAVHIVERFRDLTEREREVFWLLSDGYTTKAIAERLNISARTAEVHRSRVLEKFHTNRLADIIRASRTIGSLRS
ncbi:response regulator transcription factor [Ferrovibrio sp.]|uniref:response regulator transcription factor n=1 Tax=Ferrovibrio sp. TaxID=1917215 RepID=UPI0039C867FE